MITYCIRVEAPERALEAATRRSDTGTIHLRLDRKEVR
jgi:hypothetical protein